jgi:hypothetical protein
MLTGREDMNKRLKGPKLRGKDNREKRPKDIETGTTETTRLKRLQAKRLRD